jgi:hypothetical protein
MSVRDRIPAFFTEESSSNQYLESLDHNPPEASRSKFDKELELVRLETSPSIVHQLRASNVSLQFSTA